MLPLKESGGTAYWNALYYFCNFFCKSKIISDFFKKGKTKPAKVKHFPSPTSSSSLYLFPFPSSFLPSSCSHFLLKQLSNNFCAARSNWCPPVPILTWEVEGSIWCYESVPFWSISFSSPNQHISWSSSCLSDDSFSSFGRVLSLT